MTCSPSIVYSNSWIGQTAALGTLASPIVMFTPSQEGLFRVSVGLRVTSGSFANVALFTVRNSVVQQEYLLDNNQVMTGGDGVCSFIAYSAEPIAIYTSISPSVTYDVLACVEELI